MNIDGHTDCVTIEGSNRSKLIKIYDGLVRIYIVYIYSIYI